jgi:outer membrane lipoprotein SlyB
MEATQVHPSPIAASHIHPRIHPLVLLAASSVTALSLAGVAVLAGWLPGPGTRSALPARLATTPAATSIPIRENIAVPKKAARTLAQSGEPESAGVSRDAPAAVAASPAVAAVPAPTYGAVAPAPTFVTTGHEPAYRVAAPQPPVCNDCGVVETVREVAVEPKGSGGGAIAGGLLGGLLANQIGKGSGRSIATVLGAVGGAYAGNYIEKTIRESKRYEVVVRFEDGSTRTFSSESAPAWKNGDRVRLQNGLLTMGGGRSNGNPELI